MQACPSTASLQACLSPDHPELLCSATVERGILKALMDICIMEYDANIDSYIITDVTLDAGLLARSQYSEGPATDHLDTGFSWFPCA